MVLCNRDDLADRCKSLRNLCFGKIDRFVHKELGWNFRMSNLQAAVGIAQLERLGATIEKKRKIGKHYLEAFKGNEFFQLPLLKTDYCENIFWVFGIISKAKNKSASITWENWAKSVEPDPSFIHCTYNPPFPSTERENKFYQFPSTLPNKAFIYLVALILHHKKSNIYSIQFSRYRPNFDQNPLSGL